MPNTFRNRVLVACVICVSSAGVIAVGEEPESSEPSIAMPTLRARPGTVGIIFGDYGYTVEKDFATKYHDDYVWNCTIGHRNDPEEFLRAVQRARALRAVERTKVLPPNQGRVVIYGQNLHSAYRIDASFSTVKEDVNFDALSLHDFTVIVRIVFKKEEEAKAKVWLRENVGVKSKSAIDLGNDDPMLAAAGNAAFEERIRENPESPLTELLGGITTEIGGMTLGLWAFDSKRSFCIYPTPTEPEAWRVWVSADKKKFCGRFLDVVDDTVFVQSGSGAVSRMKKHELCAEDWMWVEGKRGE